MFIELTDHLICPADHEEQYLVLLPEEMDGRRVVRADLGCPVCHRVMRVRDGVAELGVVAAADSSPSGLSPEAIATFLGLSGPGGFVALVGQVGRFGPDLLSHLPGVGLALINPPEGTVDSLQASVVRADRLPLKRASMRGVVLGPEFAEIPGWIADAIRATLPGLRVVAEGGDPPETIQVLGRTAQCWVGLLPSVRSPP
jgi:hypothetical protein